jgi:hypothetical protein
MSEAVATVFGEDQQTFSRREVRLEVAAYKLTSHAFIIDSFAQRSANIRRSFVTLKGAVHKLTPYRDF